MKKLLGTIMVLATTAIACLAVDYDNHVFPVRVYRVALGSGVAPSAADMDTVRLHNGDMVLNTDDGVLYIMHETNVYTKFTSAGAATITSASIAGISSGVQAETATNTATITAENKLINVTGGAGATILVTLASPTSAQLGEFVRLRNVGTNTLNVIVKGGTGGTNAVAVSKQMLIQAIDVDTTGWEPVYTTP